MDLETAQTGTTVKLAILKQGEYDMWRLRIEQYFQVQEYALWDVIENGNSFKPAAQTITNVDGTSATLIPGPVTTDEKAQNKNDVKAISMLLMALPNEHLMTFNQYKDAKTLFAAIQTRFGGNEATKKTQKTLLKQMYKNFSAPSTKSLDSIFIRLQKIVSQLAILGENISQEDLNLNFLRSLPSEWNTHVKRTISSSSSSQNIAFVSSPSSTNEVNTAYGVSTASTQVSTANLSDATVYAFLASQPNGSQLVYEDLKQILEDNLEETDLKWQLALLSMRTRRFFQKTGRKITINGSDTTGYDKSKVECFNCHKMRHFARECRGPKNQDSRNMNQDSSRRTVNVEETSSKAMVAIDEAGFDWIYMADDEVPTNMGLMALSDSKFNKSEFNLATYKRGLASVEEQLVFYKKNEPEFEGYEPKTSKSVSEDISNEVRESIDAPLVEELVSDDKLEKKTIFSTVAKIEFVRPKQQEKPAKKPADCNYHQRERVVSGNNYTRVNYNYSAKKAHPSAHRNMVPRAVLMKTGLRSLNTARPVNTAHPKTTVYSARPMSHFSKSAQSTVKRPYQIRTTLTNKNFSQKVNTAKGKFYTARPKAVNTARPNSAVVNAVRANQIMLNARRQDPEDQGYVDSGCSRHMTGNMSYLSNFKSKYADGYSHLVGNPKEGKLLVKKLLKLMCDKKNSVVFADTGCFVLSPDFKLADESQVLLKVPRKNNIYSVNMKNIVPKECLTYLVAKATLDESMLWHRRLGHVNFKTINKLVKENLVRGLPSKRFENDQTCVACLKGKQHKASCKSKIHNSITQPLFMLHIDLFGPTFVSSLMNKKYCLVVTDDYSRFTWVFILATKDETSGILKRFLTETKNLVDKKVKIIRCDNGTEFKNRVMSEFCEEKGITKEFSIARTP
ncbi:ribonuclease H-like domain-containing protein [Tanacetum coccineum]